MDCPCNTCTNKLYLHRITNTSNSTEDATPAPITRPSDVPTSEVGSDQVISLRGLTAIMRELVQSREQSSRAEPRELSLPRFNSDIVGTDPAAWCSTVTLLIDENPSQGSELIAALSRALEGSAAHWLTQVPTDKNVTWPTVKELFIMRFGGQETAASALIKASKEQPLGNESLGAFGSRLRSFLKARWRNLTNLTKT
jgi:hypothetical protein